MRRRKRIKGKAGRSVERYFTPFANTVNNMLLKPCKSQQGSREGPEGSILRCLRAAWGPLCPPGGASGGVLESSTDPRAVQRQPLMILEAFINFLGDFMSVHEASDTIANTVNSNEFDASYKKREKVEFCQG